MLKVSSSLPDIAVIRGGNKDFKQSLIEGGEVLSSLTKIGYKPIDVLIDKEGEWTMRGKPTDAHEVYTRAHTIVDTTHMKGEAYQTLAKKMGIPLLFSHDQDILLDREDMYRILRQKGVKVPDTFVIRSSAPFKTETLHKVWSKYHTPLLLRPLKRLKEAPSKLVKMFNDLEETVRGYHEKGIDMHVLSYKKAPTSSIAVLPNFRGEDLYIPIWVETFSGINDIPNVESRIQAHINAPDFRKEQINKYVKDVYEALDLKGPACIDLIPFKDEYIVVNVDPTPSLRKDGRFMQSLSTTGVDIGQYIHSHIQNELAR